MQLSLLKLEVHFADETCHRKSFLLTRHILTMFHWSFERRTLTGVFLLWYFCLHWDAESENFSQRYIICKSRLNWWTLSTSQCAHSLCRDGKTHHRFPRNTSWGQRLLQQQREGGNVRKMESAEFRLQTFTAALNTWTQTPQCRFCMEKYSSWERLCFVFS